MKVKVTFGKYGEEMNEVILDSDGEEIKRLWQMISHNVTAMTHHFEIEPCADVS